MKSIGIYPGTFDPIHEGHLAFAEATRLVCNLDVVYFIPEQDPRNKKNVSKLQARFANLRQCIAKRDGLETITLNSDRFSVGNTKPEIEKLLGTASYTLLVGSDVAQKMEGWPEADVLLRTWKLAIGMRSNDKAEFIDEMFKRIESTHGLLIDRAFIYTDKARLSSSDFREPS